MDGNRVIGMTERLEQLRFALAFALSSSDVACFGHFRNPSMRKVATRADALVIVLQELLARFEVELPPLPNDAEAEAVTVKSVDVWPPIQYEFQPLDRTQDLPEFAAIDRHIFAHLPPSDTEKLGNFFPLEKASEKALRVLDWLTVREAAGYIFDHLDGPRNDDPKGRTWRQYVREKLLPREVALKQGRAIIPSTRRIAKQLALPVLQQVGNPARQTELNLYAPVAHHVPILELFDAAGRPLIRRGKGAPYELRIFQFSCFRVPVQYRKGGQFFSRILAREMMDMLWPGGWKPFRHRSHMEKALRNLITLEIRLPNGYIWRPVSIPLSPGPALPLNEPIVFHHVWPPEVTDGPSIPFWPLVQLGATNGRAYNAAIAGRSLLYKLGFTWVKNPRTRTFGWTKQIKRYPVLTIDDRHRLIFGSRGGHRTRCEINEAWEHPSVADCGVIVQDKAAKDPERGVTGWRITPAEIVQNLRG